MAKEVRSWEANDGSLHKTECEAAACDLQNIINASPCAENSPYAKKTFDWLKREAREIAAALIAYADACPVETVAAEPAPEVDFPARRAAATGTMQEMARGADKEKARAWLRSNDFDDLRDFSNTATPAQVEAWETFAAEIEDGHPPEFQTTSEHNELAANKD